MVQPSPTPWPCPPRRLRSSGVVGPVVFWVTASQVFSDLEVGLIPEAREVAGDLDRSPRGCEELEGQGHPSASDPGGLGQPEEVVAADGEGRVRGGVVPYADRSAARD